MDEGLVLDAAHQVVCAEVLHAWCMDLILVPEVSFSTEALDDVLRPCQ